jgi:hypothetical protein
MDEDDDYGSKYDCILVFDPCFLCSEWDVVITRQQYEVGRSTST